MKKNILITNDDGISSRGLHAACESVCGLGNVTIAAPSVQKSGVGRGISVLQPIRVSKVRMAELSSNRKIRADSIRAYSVDGTPTDAVIVGLYGIMAKKPDLLLSGFNIGENLSTESVTTSGTIGAALEAASNGIPALAVSVQVKKQAEKFDKFGSGDFSVPVNFVRKVAAIVLEGGLPDGVDLLNINFPNKTTKRTKVEITRLAKRVYRTIVHERRDPRGTPYYWVDGTLVRDAEKGTDVHAVLKNGRISVTPVSLDSTAEVDLNDVRELIG